MLDFERRYTREEAAPLIAAGYFFVDCTALDDDQPMFQIRRTLDGVELLDEMRAVCEGR